MLCSFDALNVHSCFVPYKLFCWESLTNFFHEHYTLNHPACCIVWKQDIVTENNFEKRLLADVIPPSDINVTFDDIGALENVKDTLKELVMLPLQRPELFCKGQLTKVLLP